MTDKVEDGSAPIATPPKVAPVRILWRQWAMDRACSILVRERTTAEIIEMADAIFEWVIKPGDK